MSEWRRRLWVVGIVAAVSWGMSSCGGGSEAAGGGDEAVTAGEATTAAEDATAADDAAAVTDDGVKYSGSIAGTLALGPEITVDAKPPYNLALGLFKEANFDPVNGPTGPPENGIALSVASFPVAYSIGYNEGDEVWIAAHLDNNESGLEGGADTGDLAGLSGSRVTVPATGVDITLDVIVP